MQIWRVLWLASLSLPLALTGCGDSHKRTLDDSSDAREEEDADLDGGEPEDGATVDDDGGEGDIDSEVCEPKSCSEQGFNCGMPDDTCGGPLSCGGCEGYETCGGGGKQFVCGCTPATCESLSSERGASVCGMIDDGCGGVLDCGNPCTGSDTCGGGPAANECGCTPNPSACAGKECGTADDGCGKTVQCGSDAGACSANRACNAQQTCACKTDLTAFCAGKCGQQQTPDGCTAACPACPQCAGGEGTPCNDCSCPAGPEPGTQDDGVCRSGTCCMPESVASLCGTAQCGTRVNRCGQTVSCGSCDSGLACSIEGKCDTPVAAALVGKYGVRTVGFTEALGVVTRAAGLMLVNIYRDSGGRLMMHEQSCWSAGYTRRYSEGKVVGENVVTEIPPSTSVKYLPTEIELDLLGTANLPGPKDWVRGVQPLSQSASGWRRGRPSYCPANGGPADPNHPDFEPANDPRALGAKKPWLGGATCSCPAEEFAKPGRAPCRGLSGARLTACMADPETLSLPYSSGGNAAASTVTDCRVVDDDLNDLPGCTATVTATIFGIDLQATIGSASVTANLFWGAADTSGAKRHWGVTQDQPELQSANVTCEGSVALCGASGGDGCLPYSAEPYDRDHRVNVADFVSLHDKTPPAGGWAGPNQPALASCQEILAKANDPEATDWFPAATWHTRYPPASLCPP